jgi:hypothetical protein
MHTDQAQNSTQEPLTQLHVRKDVAKGQIIKIGSPIKMFHSSKACLFNLPEDGCCLACIGNLESAPRISVMNLTLKLAASKKQKLKGLLHLRVKV